MAGEVLDVDFEPVALVRTICANVYCIVWKTKQRAGKVRIQARYRRSTLAPVKHAGCPEPPSRIC